ncbi:MAG: transglutaminase domain-containing protein [Bacteroidota bacterium]
MLKLTKLLIIALICTFSPCLLFAQQPDFKKTDAYARAAPASVGKNLESLNNYLVKGQTDDIQKVRAFYVWISQNINYDVKSFFSGNIAIRSANDVLQSRIAVCDGYSELFRTLCYKSKIKCVSVHGYAKGYGWTPKEKVHDNHTWSAVKLGNDWKLIDVTWGSGYLSPEGEYKPYFEEGCFLGSPQHFILNHLPTDPLWQLLPCPVPVSLFLRDSNTVKPVVAALKPCGNFADSLESMLALDSMPRVLLTARHAYAYNPENLEPLAFAYLNYSAWYRNKESAKIPVSDYAGQLRLSENLLVYQTEARKYFKKIGTDRIRNALAVCERNIFDAENYNKRLRAVLNQQ